MRSSRWIYYTVQIKLKYSLYFKTSKIVAILSCYLRDEKHDCEHGYMETMPYGNFKIVLEFSVKILIEIAVNFRLLS